tara:strand:+ start:3133 stop:7341 length:4209 start_codon:yes stop_codon:yes gene_type:complete
MYERCTIDVKIRPSTDSEKTQLEGERVRENSRGIRRIEISILLVIFLISGTLATSLQSDSGLQDEGGNRETLLDSSDFEPAIDGNDYLTIEESVFSATNYLKKKWIEDGYPGLVKPFDSGNQLSKNSLRSCEQAWSVGESDNFTTTSGNIFAEVKKTSTNSAIFVEEGFVVSSTVLNDIAATWDSIIFPTNVDYFGAVPDLDNNCQVEILLYSIDGSGGTGGYFQPGISSIRESLFIDIDDLEHRNSILSHELERLIHNAWDPYEYIWVDEGAAAMAEFLCFNANEDLDLDANSWTSNTSKSLRWWNDRGSDFGSGFLFMLFLEDKLGGPQAIRSLVSDSALGGKGVENLARSPGSGSTPIGITMGDIFANFSAAVTLDSPQGAFGFSNLDLKEDCSAGGICKASPAGTNQQWSQVWQTTDVEMEGWGMRSFRFSQGNGDPLSIMVQPDSAGFDGSLLVKETVSGSWAMSKINIDPSTGIGSGLVQGFGNETSDAILLVWYDSPVDDCDYDFANCGILSNGQYPTGSISVFADLVSEPAQISIESIESFDRDGDSLDDSIVLDIEATSSAFFETLEVSIEAWENGTKVDESRFFISAGNSGETRKTVWFTPPNSGEWSFHAKLSDLMGDVEDAAFSLPMMIHNMKPTSSGSISSNSSQTWTQNYFFGGGYDLWGFGEENGSFEHNETPQSYLWSMGDGNDSLLKNPIHSFLDEGAYVVSLIVVDRGGYFSDPISWEISVNDSTAPNPVISIDGIQITEEISVNTNQRVQFSAFGTTDNVPVEGLFFTWSWGDGSFDSGKGLFQASHSWIDGSSEGSLYPMSLGVSDGEQYSEISIPVRVMNRVPERIFNGDLVTYTLTPIHMPEVFSDSDGVIVSHNWIFDEGVNLEGGDVSITSDFSETTSALESPSVAWRTPGLKNVSLEVIDDDGNATTAHMQIEVLNQHPVAVFNRPDDGTVESAYVIESQSFDPDGDSSDLVHIWTVSDMQDPIENTTSISRSFPEPGLFSISLVVVDELGLESSPKTFFFYIENPLPIASISFSCPTQMGEKLSEVPNDERLVSWQVPHTEGMGAFVAPDDIIRFDGSSSYDSDPAFMGKTSVDRDNGDWNGITKWIWDFGDASPAAMGPVAWHSFERAGTYTVRLTVTDGFEGGESNYTEMTVIVSSKPLITTESPIPSEYVVVGDKIDLMWNATDPELEAGLVAWLDNDALVDSDGDGIEWNDRDENLTGSLDFHWDLNALIDEDCETPEGCDGDTRNDWIGNIPYWSEPGEIRIALTVCDGVGVCSSEDFVITVLSVQDVTPAKTLADLSWEDLIPEKESFGLIALISLVAILGWLVMRQRDEDEIDAMDMSEKYGVDEVEAEGGLPGMDQHSPPPQPKYLSPEERTNKESGYVRPVRTGRRN